MQNLGYFRLTQDFHHAIVSRFFQTKPYSKGRLRSHKHCWFAIWKALPESDFLLSRPYEFDSWFWRESFANSIRDSGDCFHRLWAAEIRLSDIIWIPMKSTRRIQKQYLYEQKFRRSVLILKLCRWHLYFQSIFAEKEQNNYCPLNF